jgi:hypothetical protein
MFESLCVKGHTQSKLRHYSDSHILTTAGCATLCVQFLFRQEELWQTRKLSSARTPCARVQRNRTVNIAVPHAKAPAKHLSSIAIVAIQSAAGTSDLPGILLLTLGNKSG